jgi:hypothetical protein
MNECLVSPRCCVLHGCCSQYSTVQYYQSVSLDKSTTRLNQPQSKERQSSRLPFSDRSTAWFSIVIHQPGSLFTGQKNIDVISHLATFDCDRDRLPLPIPSPISSFSNRVAAGVVRNVVLLLLYYYCCAVKCKPKSNSSSRSDSHRIQYLYFTLHLVGTQGKRQTDPTSVQIDTS